MDKVKLGPQTLLYPMPAVLVGALVGDKPNFMTAAWCAIAAYKPPAVAVALQSGRYTLEGILDKESFSVNIPSCDLVKKVDHCGLYSGKNRDKSSIFDVFYGTLGTAPMIEQCPLNLECRLAHTLKLHSHIQVIGEIVETYIYENCLTKGKADPAKINPLIYAPGTMQYHCLGEAIARAFHVGEEEQ